MSLSPEKNTRVSYLRTYALPAVLTFIVIVLIVVYYFYPDTITHRWSVIRGDYEYSVTHEVQDLFSRYQQQTADAVTAVASSGELHSYLSDSLSGRTEDIFRFLIQKVPPDLSLELYDNQKRLIGWAGARGQFVDTAEIEAKPTSFLIKGPIYSYLVVSMPILNGGQDMGYLIGKRLFEVNYPINNRFISAEAFTSTFMKVRGVPPQFRFVTVPMQGRREEEVMIPLRGIDQSIIGTGMIPLTPPDQYISQRRQTIWNITALAIILLVGTLGYRLCRGVHRRFSAAVTIAVVTIMLWFIRYLLVWFSVPQAILELEIFKPVSYASPFGFGITRSLGDLFLSSLFLVVNIIIAASIIKARRRDDTRVFPYPIPNGVNIAWILVFSIVVILFISLRSWAAIVQSAFFDSTIDFSVPSAVQIQFDLFVMLVTLFLIASCFSVLVLILMKIIRSIFSTTILVNRSPVWYYGIALLLFAGGSIIFEVFQMNRIMEPWYHFTIISVVLILEKWYANDQKSRKFQPVVRNLVVIGILTLMLIIPLLKMNSDRKEYASVELLAREIVRPEDAWLSHLLSQSLDELAGFQVGEVMRSENNGDISAIAFTQWARSTLSRIGNNCSVTYTGTDGSVVSEFAIGLSPVQTGNATDEPITTKQIYRPSEKEGALFSARVYTGFAPLYDTQGTRRGSVMVRIAGGKGAFLESYSSDIFRSYPRISLGLTEHDIALLEYADERLVASSSDEVPKGIPLPRSLRDSRHSPESIWLDEHIGEGVYKLFFFRDFANPNGTIWYALGFEKSGTQWELFLHLKFFLFYLIVSIVMIGTALLWLFVRGNRIVLNFKTKLLAAFLLVSLIPVILLAYYNRYYAEERARQDLGKALSEQTSLIVSEIQRIVVMNAPVDLSVVNDRDCATITERLGTGFSIYRGSYIHATSMPELFTAELIDPWLPADAVLHVLLREQGFFFQQQTIGTYQYFIGYRPIYTQAGSINGIVAVPSLYRYTDVERELIERNVYLFGAYAIILLISIAVGILFTNQLYHPLRRLQKATEIIASGKFDIGITKRRSDEFGDLEESFIHMTQDLREAQMQIIKAEREAAWKEMAKQVAHEIKNPLTPMKLSIQHVEKAYRDGAKNFDEILHQVTQTILQQIEILSNIATEFSRMAKMPDRKIEKVDTNRILEEACNLFSQYGGIRSSFDLKAVSPVIYADKEELQRMFVNILRNAVQAMQEEGDIAVESSADDTMVDIRISDTGPGIPEGVLSHIFDPYFSTKKEGMGLGLTLVKKTIEDLWGTIEIRSTVGKGTTVHIRLPLTGRERQ